MQLFPTPAMQSSLSLSLYVAHDLLVVCNVFTSRLCPPINCDTQASRLPSVTWHPQIVFNGRTECCESSTPNSGCLGPRFRTQNAACDATSGYPVRHVVLCTESFNAAFRPRKYSAHNAKVLRGAEASTSHILEPPPELLTNRQIGELLSRGRKRSVVAHLTGERFSCSTMMEYFVQ